MKDSFGARSTLAVGDDSFEIYRLDAVTDGHAAKLPYSLKILLENLLRFEDGVTVKEEDIRALAGWAATQADPNAELAEEIAFRPARVLMQDFTGVPGVAERFWM